VSLIWNVIVELIFQIKKQKEDFNDDVGAMKQRKAALLEDLEETSRKLIDVQFRLDAGKRKPVNPLKNKIKPAGLQFVKKSLI